MYRVKWPKEYVGIKESDENSIKSDSLFQWHLHEAYSQRVNGELIPKSAFSAPILVNPFEQTRILKSMNPVKYK